jgi:hypothetical protein
LLSSTSRSIYNDFSFYLLPPNFFVLITGAPLYALFGPSLVFIKVANLLFSVLAIYNIYRISCIWFGRREMGLCAALLFTASPYLLFTLGAETRDPVVLFLLTEFFYLTTTIVHMRRFRDIPACIFIFVLIHILRAEMGTALFLTFMLVFVMNLAFSKGLSLPVRAMKKMVFVLVIGAGVGAMLYLVMNNPRLLGFGKGISFESIETKRAAWSSTSAYLSHVDFSRPAVAVKYLPLAVLYFMFSPLPWQVHDFKLLLGMADSVYLFLVCLSSIQGLKRLYEWDRAIFSIVVVFLLGGILGSAVMQANVGAAMRHRMQFSFIFYIFSSYSVYNWFKQISFRRIVEKREVGVSEA